MQPTKAKIKVDNDPDHKHHLDDATSQKAEQQAYLTDSSPRCSAPVYDNVLPVRREAKKNVAEIELQDLEMEENVAYGSLWH